MGRTVYLPTSMFCWLLDGINVGTWMLWVIEIGKNKTLFPTGNMLHLYPSISQHPTKQRIQSINNGRDFGPRSFRRNLLSKRSGQLRKFLSLFCSWNWSPMWQCVSLQWKGPTQQLFVFLEVFGVFCSWVFVSKYFVESWVRHIFFLL